MQKVSLWVVAHLNKGIHSLRKWMRIYILIIVSLSLIPDRRFPKPKLHIKYIYCTKIIKLSYGKYIQVENLT